MAKTAHSTLLLRSRQLSLALADIREGFAAIHVWPTMAVQEIRQRYRRTTLGPLWLTISTAALILGMGPLYGRLFGQQIGEYFPYLTVSYVTWLLIANMIGDACVAFTGWESIIKQIKLPLMVHVLRTVSKNLLLFAHNLVVVLGVLAFYPPQWGWHLLLAPLGLFLLALNGIWLSFLLGMACARFRDVPPIVTSVVQVAFFLTPVMWQKGMLGSYQWAADINPLFHLLELVRRPILGGVPDPLSWAVVAGMSILGGGITLLIFARYRARIAYWV